MATLTSSDYQYIKKRIRSNPAARAEFKSWSLDKATWYALFQTIEDWNVDGFTTRPAESEKEAMEAVVGPLTNQRAIAVWTVWVGWKLSNLT